MLKRFIVISLLIVLTSACTAQITTLTPPTEEVQPVFSNTLESIATATSTPLIVVATQPALPTLDFTCPGAPTPRVSVGQQVTVVVDNSDKLKLRSERRISPDTVKMDLDQFTQVKILEGPVCVSSAETGASYWFWQVEVIPTGEIGWVAEGDSLNYFIEGSTTVAIVDTATALICTGMPAPRVAIGQQVTVVTENTDKLKLREIPEFSPNTVVMDLDTFTKLNILEGPVCAYSNETKIYYWLWKVQVLPGGETGWVAEGDFFRNFIE